MLGRGKGSRGPDQGDGCWRGLGKGGCGGRGEGGGVRGGLEG